MGTCTAGGTGGVGLGALAAQATASRAPLRAARRWKGVKGRVIPNSYTRLPGRGVSFGQFLAEIRLFLPVFAG
jgi:hypothetical protein